MFTGLLHRMILAELFKVFMLALVGLTGILLLAGVFSEASKNGLSPGQILAAIPLLVPSTLPYTLPTTTLFATCLVYGRLAHDNEILAIKAAGINIMRVVWPGIMLGILASGLTIFLYYRTIPHTHFLLRVTFLKDIEEFMYGMLKKEGMIRHPKLSMEIHVRNVVNRRLVDARFMRKDKDGENDMIARAAEATMTVDMAKHQLLLNMHHCNILSRDGGRAFFEDKIWPVDLPPDFSNPVKTRPYDMTWQEMLEEARRVKGEIEKTELDIAAHEAPLALHQAPPSFEKHVFHLKNQRKQMEQELRDIAAEMQMRPALAFGCLCFVLVGCPVGIWSSRGDYLSAFITCFLPIVLIYYPLILCGINLARTGHVNPTLAIWGADILMGIASLALYRKLLRN